MAVTIQFDEKNAQWVHEVKTGGVEDKAGADEALQKLLEAHEHVVQPDLVAQKAREPFFSQDEDMPQFVKKLIEEALRGGAISRISEKLPTGTTRGDVRTFFEDQLSQPQGWSLKSLTENYSNRFGVPEDDAVTAVRTQTTNILNEARAEGYRAQGESGEAQFKWIGPDDDDNTDACEWLRQQSNPDYGGEPKTLDELRGLVQDAQREFFPDFRGADWTPHYNCRHTYVQDYS